MVEKRTLILIVLATLVWALITSGLAAYQYLEVDRYQKEASEKGRLLLEIAEGYKGALERQDLLMRDYNALLGEYYMFMGENYSVFVEKYARLLSNLGNNYTAIINGSPELKEAYKSLMNAIQELKEKETVTKAEFEPLLMEFNGLLRSIVAKELENLIGENTTIKVNLCIDYGNGTTTWYNISVSPGMSLFDLTQQVAQIEYDYYPAMEPGHVLMKTINGVASSPSEWKYWFWYYWDEDANQWVYGQVGCDAWTLRDNGTYKWIYKVWGDP
ncbi:MAG: hypothetical protein QXJ07_03450 [Candidatus Bathyarchaeia archaeon]